MQQINHHNEELEKCLFDALYALMTEHTIDEITVGDILEKSHVSRSSFYRRYRDKYELLTDSYTRLLDHTFLHCMQGASWRQSSIALYRILAEHPLFFKHAIIGRGPDSLYQSICDTVLSCVEARFAEQDKDLRADWRMFAAAKAYICGTMDVTCDWAQADMPYPAEELIDWLCAIMPECLKPYCL